MITELRKSINAILSERLSSPFYGALIISWIIWNWKTIYLTLFVSESKINGTKIDFIIENYSSSKNLIIYPILSTLVILLIIPFISNGAYWTNLKFKNWRQKKRNNIENKQLLTLEQSIEIRKELKQKEFEYEEILQKREKQIVDLNQIINEFNKHQKEKLSELEKDINLSNDTSKITYKSLKENKEAFDFFEQSYKALEKDEQFPSDVPDLIIEYYIVNGIFERNKYASGKFYYTRTSISKTLYKMYFTEKY